ATIARSSRRSGWTSSSTSIAAELRRPRRKATLTPPRGSVAGCGEGGDRTMHRKLSLLGGAAILALAACASDATLERVGYAIQRGNPAPVIGPEIGLDAPVAVPKPIIVTGAAYDGTNHVVVWDDDRIDGSNTTIRAGRIAPDGTLLDPFGITVAGPSDA